MPFNNLYLSDDELFGQYDNSFQEPEPESFKPKYEKDSIFEQASSMGHINAPYMEEPEYISDDEIFRTFDLGERVQETRDEEQRLLEKTKKSPIRAIADGFADAFFSTVEAAHDLVAIGDRFGQSAAKGMFRMSDSYDEAFKKLKAKYPDVSDEEINQAINEAFDEKYVENAQEALGPAHGFVTENKELQERMRRGSKEWRELAEMGQPFGMSEYAKASPESLQYYIEGAGTAIGQVGKMFALNAALPGLGYAEIAAVGLTGTQKEAEARMKEKGIDPNDAYWKSMAEGAMAAGLEAVLSGLPGERMMRIPKIRNRVLGSVAELLKVGGLEAVEESATELGQMALQEWIEEDPEAFDDWNKRVKDAAIFGAIGGMAGGGVPAVARGLATSSQRLRQDAAERAEQIYKLTETEEGREKLRALSEIESPSRKDFAEAGVTAHMSKSQRKQLAKSVPELLKALDEKAAQEQEDARTLEGLEAEQQARGLRKDIQKAFRTDESMAKAVGTVAESLITQEEFKELVKVEKGEEGRGELGALYQIPEAVEAAVSKEGWSSTTDEEKFFGKMWPAAIKTARKAKGAFKGAAGLAVDARKVWSDLVKERNRLLKEWNARPKGEKGPKPTIKDPFKSGEKFEKAINMRGIRGGVKEAVKDLLPFIKDRPEFQEYYRNEVVKERAAIAQKHPELATDDAAWLFKRMLDGVGSAQTDLFKNTQESERAYAGFKQSGRLPVVVDETGPKPRPVFALPKDSEFGVTLPGEIDAIEAAIIEMDAEISDVLKEHLPTRSRLTKGDLEQLEKYSKKFKDRMNTTSEELAANLWHEWKRDPKAFKTRVRTAFEIAGGSSAYNKARNYHTVNKLLDKFNGNLAKMMEFLNERVSVDELKALNKEMGFGGKAGDIGGLNDIRDTVWVAEGQETMIPRTFIFGPKVGAYILNRMADAHPQNVNYNTMDVWESRVWRSYFKDLGDIDLGIASGVPRRVYMRAAREFPAEFKRQTGMDVSISAGQAARWYFGMEMMRKAGYSKVGDKQTIARYTQNIMEEYMRQELGAANPDMIVLEEGLRAIREAELKTEAEEIAEKTEIFKGSERKLGKEVVGKKLTKAEEEARAEEKARLQQEEAAKRKVQEEQFKKEGAVVTQDVITTPSDVISSVTTLFQKSAGKILGLMRQDPNGQIVVKGFEGANAETAIHEVLHGARRIIWEAHKRGGEKASGMTNEEINLIENWAGQKQKGSDEWTERMEERFVNGGIHFLATGRAPNRNLEKAFKKFRAFLKKLWTKVKSPASDIRMRPEVEAAFAKMFTRAQRLKKGKVQDARQKRQAKDYAAKDIAAPKQRGFKQEVGAAKTDTRPPEVKAIFPTRAAVAETGRAETLAGVGGENVPPEFIRDGKVTLYRYSHGDRGETYTIDPAKAQPRSYSRNDYERAKTPRTFFYLNTSEKEGIVGNNLYSTQIDAKDIYNLITDPQGLKAQFPSGNSFDFDAIFQVLIDQGKRGVYYNPGFHVVNLFDAVEAKRTPDVARSVDKQKTQEIWSSVRRQVRDNVPPGFTYDPRTGTFPNTGYAVAPAKSSEVVIDINQYQDWQIPGLIQEYAGMFADRLAEDDMYLGGWMSEGKLYLDVSMVYANEGQAVEVAKKNNQKAIFNLNTQEEIKTEGRAEIASGVTLIPSMNELPWDRNKEGEYTGETFSKREVVQGILDDIGITAHENFKGSKAAGYYVYINSRVPGDTSGLTINIRASELANIGVALHEATHYYDDINGIDNRKASLLTQDQIDAITRLDYNRWIKGGKPLTFSEGLAEATRLYVMNEHHTMPEHDQIIQGAIRSLMASVPEYGHMIERNRARVKKYMRQELAEKVNAAINWNSTDIIDPSNSYFVRQEQRSWSAVSFARLMSKKLMNRQRVLEETEKRIKKVFKEVWSRTGSTVSADDAWANIIRKSKGLASQLKLQMGNLTQYLVDQAMQGEALVDRHGTVYNESAKKIFEGWNEKDLETFGQYMYSKVALQRAIADPEYIVGEVNLSDLDRFVKDVDRKHGKRFSDQTKRVTQYFNNLTRMLLDNNMITQEQYNGMLTKQELYMPFYRQFADHNNALGSKFLGVKAPIHTLGKGSVAPVLNVYDAMIDRTSEVIGAINRKEVERSFVTILTEAGVAGEFMQEVQKGEEGPGVIESDGRYYKVDESVYEAMTLSGNPKQARSVAKVISYLGAPTSIARMMMVNVNPYFPIRNFPRDMKTLAVKGLMDETGIKRDMTIRALKIAAKYAKAGLKEKIPGLSEKTTEIQDLYERLGGGHNTRVLTTQASQGTFVREAKKRIGRKQTFGAQKLSLTETIINGLEKAAELQNFVEQAPRLGAFQATLEVLGFANEDGSLKQAWNQIPEWALTQAMSNAQESTVNFNRRGEWASRIEPFFLFYNAAIQGSWQSTGQTIEKIQTDKQARNRFIAITALGLVAKAGAFAAMASWSAGGDDEDQSLLDLYFELPDYYKEADDLFLFNLPGMGRYAIRIPKEREWAFVSRSYEALIQQAMYVAGMTKTPAFDTDELTRLDVENDVFEALAEALFEKLPVTGGLVPTGLQLGFGYDLFRGEPLEGKWDDEKPVKYRTSDRVSWLANTISQDLQAHRLGLSPKETDFILRNSFGSMFGKVGDFIQAAGGALQGETPTSRDISTIPFVGPFFIDARARQSVSDYYIKSQHANQDITSWKAGDITGKAAEKLLQNVEMFGVADSIMKSIRESKMSDEDKANWQTGLARWALGREPVAEYPNPLVEYNTLPPDVKQVVAKTIKSLNQKPRLTENTQAGLERMKQEIEARAKVSKKLKGLK